MLMLLSLILPSAESNLRMVHSHKPENIDSSHKKNNRDAGRETVDKASVPFQGSQVNGVVHGLHNIGSSLDSAYTGKDFANIKGANNLSEGRSRMKTPIT